MPNRGRQCDGERIAAQHHEGDRVSDGPLAVRAESDERGHVRDGGHLATLGGHAVALSLQGLPVRLRSQAVGGDAKLAEKAVIQMHKFHVGQLVQFNPDRGEVGPRQADCMRSPNSFRTMARVPVSDQKRTRGA